uniref:Homing endonuclease LAGLIDADG domain-containing protein n=1 Tax=Lobochlamys segnis TaxID=52035 RepID=Q8WKZ5_9CHLO|nr:unknown [Lobochlamys segnis]
MGRKKLQDANSRLISKTLDQIINGYIMGDGHVRDVGNLTVEHGPHQRKFAEWLLAYMAPICIKNRELSKSYNDDNTVKSYRFNTQNVLKNYHSNWYKVVEIVKNKKGIDKPKYKKHLPNNIQELFTPLFIAVWYACDGTATLTHVSGKFEVTAFTEEERAILKNLFLTKYDIKSQINRSGFSASGTPQYSLVIAANSFERFRRVISKDTTLIQDLLPYKLRLPK